VGSKKEALDEFWIAWGLVWHTVCIRL